MAAHHVTESAPPGQLPIWVPRELFGQLHKVSLLSPQALGRVLRVVEREPDSFQLQIIEEALDVEWAGLIDRFMTHVDTASSPTGCWLWTGAVGDEGYGWFTIEAI